MYNIYIYNRYTHIYVAEALTWTFRRWLAMRRADFAGPFDWIYSSAQMVRYRGPKIGQIDHRHGMISKDSHLFQWASTTKQINLHAIGGLLGPKTWPRTKKVSKGGSVKREPIPLNFKLKRVQAHFGMSMPQLFVYPAVRL